MQAEELSAVVGYGWRRNLASALHRSGLLAAFRVASQHYELGCHDGDRGRLRKARVPKYVVLGYHNVGVDGLPLYCRLSQQTFAEQMKHIRRNYRIISLRQMLNELRRPSEHKQSLVVTFDDGYLGTYSQAFPVLQKYAIPATVYLTTGLIDSGETPWYDRIFLQFQQMTNDFTVKLDTTLNFRVGDFQSRIEAATVAVMYLRGLPDDDRRKWCESLNKAISVPRKGLPCTMMSWKQIREMSQAGISFGCHTMTHPVLSRVSPEGVAREVSDSKSLIEARLQCEVRDFAFPFGKSKDCGSIGRNILSRLGLESAITTIVGVNQPGIDCFRLRRMVQGEESSIALFAYRLQRLFFNPVDEELSSSISEPALSNE